MPEIRSNISVSSVGKDTPLLHIRSNNEDYLVDTGAEVSIVRPRKVDLNKPATSRLTAANGSVIKSFGSRMNTIKLPMGQYRWQFHIANVSRSIIGADFLRQFDLLPDLTRRRLICYRSLTMARGFIRGVPGNLRGICQVDVKPATTVPAFTQELLQMLKARPALTTLTFDLKEPKHGVEHDIKTEGAPIRCQPRRHHPDKVKIAREELDFLLEKGIVVESDSPWSSPLHIAPKPDGGWRPCGDFRRLNMATIPDSYPLPRVSDFTNYLSGKRIFSKVDLIKGFHQIPIKLEDQPKTAISTPFGLYHFRRMPFGLRNAPQAFQRLMNSVIRGLEDFCFVYLDDILVASSCKDQHRKHLTRLFDRLEEHGLVLKESKCLFGVEEITFLGHLVNSNGITPMPAKVEAIVTYPEPQDAKAMERFLGMINYYHRFMPHAAEVLRPLHKSVVEVKPTSGITNTTSGTTPRRKLKKKLEWSPEVSEAFKRAKEAIVNATKLAHPVPKAKIAVTTDASEIAIGAVLEQLVKGEWQPLGFFSKQLSQAQQKYSTFDRELLAIHLAIRKFRYYVEGFKFTVYTDHMPLLAALEMASEPHSARQTRQLAAIAEYTMDIQHVSGRANVVADALSRVQPSGVLLPNTLAGTPCIGTGPSPDNKNTPWPSQEEEFDAPPGFLCAPVVLAKGIDYAELARVQADNEEILHYRTACNGLILKDLQFDAGFSLLCDVKTGRARPVVPDIPGDDPKAWKRQVFETIHNLCHPGARTTLKVVSSKFVWHGLRKDIMKWSSQCLQCQRAKVQRHVRTPVQQLPVPKARFDHVHIDLVGPLPVCQGYRYLLTVIDRYTRWPEAIPLAGEDTETVARAYISNWISRFGLPAVMTSDRGPQFISRLWRAIQQLLGTDLHTTTSWHPQANGMIERVHRTMKSSLKAKLGSNPNWIDELPWIMLGLRTAPKEDLEASAAEMVYGSTLTVPGDLLQTSSDVPVSQHLRQLREVVGNFRPKPVAHHGAENNPVHVPRSIQNASYVYIRKDGYRAPLEPPYHGPYRVLSKNDKYYTVQLGDKQDNVSLDRLKAANAEEKDVIQPPRRGRPPRRTQDQLVTSTGGNRDTHVRTSAPSDPKGSTLTASRASPSIAPMGPSTSPGTSLPTPTYAEVTSRCGRPIRVPQKLRD